MRGKIHQGSFGNFFKVYRGKRVLLNPPSKSQNARQRRFKKMNITQRKRYLMNLK